MPSGRSFGDRRCRMAKNKKCRSSCFWNGVSLNLLTHIPEQQLHAAVVHVEFASSCIVLHTRVLLKSCCSLYRPIYDFGFHLPRTPALNFPKKTNNPNPSPIGNKFGLFLFGPSGENRTHGLLNPIQARYQNCATPGYRPPLPYRSVATGDIIRESRVFVNSFLKIF